MRKQKWKFPVSLIQGAVACSILFCMPLNGASFDIKPVRLEFTNGNQLEKLAIKNFSNADFPIQVRAYEWHQNEKGEDVYSETDDIIVFPKITTIKSGKENYIRLGSKAGPGQTEKTYRVYIEEMPSISSDKQGANIRLYTRVGIPIFIRPIAPTSKVEIVKAAMNGGNINIRVRNAGNTHFIVTGIYVQGFDEEGNTSFSRKIGGWYLLSGTEKNYSTDVPPKVCGSINNFSVEVRTKNSTLTEQFPVETDMCGNRTETADNR